MRGKGSARGGRARAAWQSGMLSHKGARVHQRQVAALPNNRGNPLLKIPLIVYLQSTTDYLAEEWGGRHRGPFGTGIPQSEADHLRAMRDDRKFLTSLGR